MPWGQSCKSWFESLESLSMSSFLDPVVEMPRRAACWRNCWMSISLNFSTAIIFCWDPIESPFSESLSLFLLADKLSSAPADCLFSLRSAAPSLRTCQRKHSVETSKREREKEFCECGWDRETERVGPEWAWFRWYWVHVGRVGFGALLLWAVVLPWIRIELYVFELWS